MILNKSNTDYTAYSFEDFLSDDFFISSIKNPTDQSAQFWTEYEKQTPTNIDAYRSAIDYIELLNNQQPMLDEAEVTGMWHSITNSIVKTRRHKKLYYVCAVVACAALVFAITPIIHNFINNENGADIINFANAHINSHSNSGETQLVLSDDNVLAIDDKESVINYDSVGLKVNKEDVVSEKIASYNQLITPRGKRSILTLSDGTKIWVNSGTRLIYPSKFSDSKREIYVDGEIYIEVTRDENRPFYVRTKDMNVRVLGTVFNVTAYESQPTSNVVLVSGSVQVDTKKTKTKLIPNQMFLASDDGGNVSTVDVEKYTSWTKGFYNFDKENLGNVFDRLSMYYGVDIKYTAEVGKLKCSGKLDMKNNIENVLEGLLFVAPFKYEEQNGVYQISKR